MKRNPRPDFTIDRTPPDQARFRLTHFDYVCVVGYLGLTVATIYTAWTGDYSWLDWAVRQ